MDNEIFAKRIRLYILKVLNNMGYGHFGGSLSIAECLSVLYNGGLNINVNDLKNPDRDYLVLSKGHAGPALYAALYLKGIIDKDMLFSLNENDTKLPSHPDKNKTPGVDMTTGSLGQGIAVATGIAMKNKVDKKNNYTVAIVGDGELDEGQCWEAFQFAAANKLNNLIVFIDYNKRQLDGFLWEVCDLLSIPDKLRAFGFDTIEVDGKDVNAIEDALKNAKESNLDAPKAIILNTTKGQGVPFIEEIKDNHHLRVNKELSTKIDDFIRKLEMELEGSER